MKKTYYILLALLSLILFSCEEDVVLDLGKIQKRLVVEAKVTNDSPMATVSLSYSQDFYDFPDYKLLSNGTVTLQSEDGETETLTLNNKQVYESKSILPVTGKNYTLKVKIDDQEVEVTTNLPRPVAISSIIFVPNPFLQNNDSLIIFVNVADPVGEDNFFRLKVNKLHAEASNEYYLMEDTFGKDGIISMPVYYKNFTYGDTVVVEVDNLNKTLYQYYSTLSENINGSFNSIAPGNPVSNMPDNVYGYFGGYAIDRDTVIVTRMMPF